MAYEYNQKDVFDLASVLRADTHTKGDELFFKKCPYCNGGGTDKDTFSVNLQSGLFKCFRASCGKQGHFVQFARDFEFSLESDSDKRYRKLPQRKIISKPKAVGYMESRGISQAITEKYSITSRSDNEDVLVFPFFDQDNVMQFVKYRNTKYDGNGNKEWCEKDTKPILFGMSQCKEFDTLIITEGQIDSLSVAECGIENAVSVPTGAMGFTWLKHCWDWINKFKVVIVFGDNEKGEITLLDKLQKSLKTKVYAVQQEDYLHEKDANAILMKYGKQAVIQAVAKAKMPEVRKVKRLSNVKKENLMQMPKILTGFPTLDRAIGGLYYGQVILLSGKRGEGKSTVMSQIMAEALNQNIGCLAYSGELPDYHFKNWLDLQIAGKENLEKKTNKFGDTDYILPDSVSEKINKWYFENAFIYDNAEANLTDENDSVLDIIEQAVIRYDVKFVCVDNLMTAIEDDLNTNLYRQQANFVKALKQMAREHNIVIMVVAHPKKEKSEFENDSVSGSSVITDVVDVVLNYKRAEDIEEHDGELTVTKNRLTGELIKTGFANEKINMKYSISSRRVVECGKRTDKVYSCFMSEQQEFLSVEPEDAPF